MYLRFFAIVFFIVWLLINIPLSRYQISKIKKNITSDLKVREKNMNLAFDDVLAYNKSLEQKFIFNYKSIFDSRFIHPFLKDLNNYPEFKAYGFSEDTSLFHPEVSPSLSGEGSKRAISRNIKYEMSAALMLDLSPDINYYKHNFLRSSYISPNKFVISSPYISIDNFHLNDSLYQKNIGYLKLFSQDTSQENTATSSKHIQHNGFFTILNPIYYEQKLLGLFASVIDSNYFKDALNDSSYHAGGKLYFIDKNKNIIVNKNKDDKDYKQLKDTQIKPYKFIHGSKNFIFSNLIKDKYYISVMLNRFEYFWMILSGIFIPSLLTALIFALSFMIIKNRRDYRIINDLNKTDYLTGLSNRKNFTEIALTQFFTCHRHFLPCTVLLIDIDNFKKINDKYGQNLGDKCLAAIGKTLLNSTRRSDNVARYGGDKFILFLPHTPAQGAHVLSEKLRTLISEITVSNKINFTASIGCTEYDRDKHSDLQALIKHAGDMLQQAKDNGRNQTLVYWAPPVTQPREFR